MAGRLTEVRELLPEPDVFTTYGYDKAGNRTSMTTARSNTTEWSYDALSRLTTVEVPNSPNPDIVTSYGYDRAGNVTRMTDGNTGDFYTTYNPWNLQETVVEPSTTQHQDPALRTWTITYDAGGLPVGEDQPGGIEIIRVFDQLGRMTSETGDDGTAIAKTFGFDLSGRLTTVSHPSGVLTYTYDDRGLMKTAAGPAGATSFEWDELGRMETRNDPTGAFTFEWTDRSELWRLTDPLSGKTLEYTWNGASQVDLVTYSGTDLVRDYEYDNRGLLESDVMLDDTVTLASYIYTYDDDGNLKTEQVNLPGNTMSGLHNYEYDDAGRLTQWTHNSATTSYGWDGAGNRTTAGSDTYIYDARNRLTSGPEGNYTYTPRGDVANISDGTTTVTYGFDPLGRLVDYNGQVVYTYDALDRVATRGTDTFEYIGMMLDPVDDGAFEYSRSPGGRLIAQTDGTTDLLVGLDRHGDLAYLLDPATGALTDTAMFDPFGDLTAATGTTDPTVGFQGDYTDPDSDEVWMGARWYNGADAVFRSRDTIFGELATPISLNRYTYAYASPLSYWDPDGQLPAGVWLDGEYGSTEGAKAASNTTSARLARAKENMPWEFEEAQPAEDGADDLRREMADYESTNTTPETALALGYEALVLAYERRWTDSRNRSIDWGGEAHGDAFRPAQYMIDVLLELDETEDLAPSIWKSELKQMQRYGPNELDLKPHVLAAQEDKHTSAIAANPDPPLQGQTYDVNYDVWGNIAFGLTAKKLGISGGVATFGGWYAGWKSGGDNSPQDQLSIDIGYELADQIQGDWSMLTAEMVEAALIAHAGDYSALATENDPSRVEERP